MPGIVTHNKIFKDTITQLAKKEKRGPLLKSIEALFETPVHFSAGLFGAIGPNIFDYLPTRNEKDPYGSEISFFFHNGGSEKLIQSMIKRIYSYKDKNNEWAAVQRAYLYGFINHIISDALFHPFVFFYSGFPDAFTKKEMRYYREQNLLFQYNIDNYLQYHDEKAAEFDFNLDEMLAVEKKSLFYRLNRSLKSFLLESIKDAYPEIYSRLLFVNLKKSRSRIMTACASITSLDLIPYLIKATYCVKRNNSRRLADLLKKLRKVDRFLSDFIIQYPQNKKYNKEVINRHRERWDYPTGKPGMHYESIFNLMASAHEKTIALWEKIESALYAKEDPRIFSEFKINAYTGDQQLAYRDMKIKKSIRLGL